MLTKIEGRLSRHDIIDDIVETPSSSMYVSNPKSSFLMDDSKTLLNRNYSSYSNIPLLYNNNNNNNNNKSIFEQIDNSSMKSTNELRDRLHLTVPRASLASLTMSNDERRKELDLIIQHLYDGKLLTSFIDDRPSSDISESSIHMLNKGSITSTTITKNDDESKTVGNIDLLSLDGDFTSLQRELQEKELDIMHLHKEIQELQLENKILKAKVPTIYQNGYTSNNSETEVLRREKDVLQNELRTSRELVTKFQQQHHQNIIVSRANKLDEVTLHQKDVVEKKLKSYEKQMRLLTSENEKLKQYFHQTEQITTKLKRENDELHQEVSEGKKRNDELFIQEFTTLRNDLKILQQRNNELFEENHHLQAEQQHFVRRSSFQQIYPNEQQQMSSIDKIQPLSLFKLSNSDSKRSKVPRSDSSNISEASDSTNYLTTVNVERYNNRPATSIHRSATIDGNNHHRTIRCNSITGQEDYKRNSYSVPLSKSIDQPFNFRSSKTKHMVEWNDDNLQTNEGSHYRDITNYDDDHQAIDGTSSHYYQQTSSLHRSATNEHQHQSRRVMKQINSDTYDRRQIRTNVESISPKRPYAPSSISDIRLNDVVKFSRPGGKISKGIVKYIGSLPGKNDQYVGMELEDEESKHDGIYQNQRLFQCKPNKGVFVAFNKIIMAWSTK